MMARLGARRGEDGFTLVEVIVSVALFAIVLTAAGAAILSALRKQADVEQRDRAVQLAQDTIARMAQIQYAEIGFYNSDYNARPDAPAVSPIPTTFDPPGAPPVEQVVNLGTTRPDTIPLILAPLRIETVGTKTFTVQAWATWADPATTGVGSQSGGNSYKRLTVTTSYPVAANTGNCGPNNASMCVTETQFRAPTSAEAIPPTVGSDGSAVLPSGRCNQPESTSICRVYITNGIVLASGTELSAGNVPQAKDVQFFIETRRPVPSPHNIRFTWRYNTPAGPVEQEVGGTGTYTFRDLDSTHQLFQAIVPADTLLGVNGATSTVAKGVIRNGQHRVTVSVQFPSGNQTITTKARWGYYEGAPFEIQDTITNASICVPEHANTPPGNTVRFKIDGMSPGSIYPGSAGSDQSRVDEVTATVRPFRENLVYVEEPVGGPTDYDTPGEYTYTVPATDWYEVHTIGAGGGGSTQYMGFVSGGGGGGGGYARNKVRLTAGTQLRVLVGGGGVTPHVNADTLGGQGGNTVVRVGGSDTMVAGATGGGGGGVGRDLTATRMPDYPEGFTRPASGGVPGQPVFGDMGRGVYLNGGQAYRSNGIPDSETRTVSFLMEWDGTENGMPFSLGNGRDLWFRAENRFGFNTWNDDNLGVDSRALRGQRVHVTAIFRPGNGSDLYFNGKPVPVRALQSQWTSPLPRSAGGQLFIGDGALHLGAYRFRGWLDEFAVWNRALTPGEIRNVANSPGPAYTLSLAPEAFYRFDGGNPYADSSGHGRSLSDIAGGGIHTGIFSRRGSAADLSGINMDNSAWYVGGAGSPAWNELHGAFGPTDINPRTVHNGGGGGGAANSGGDGGDGAYNMYTWATDSPHRPFGGAAGGGSLPAGAGGRGTGLVPWIGAYPGTDPNTYTARAGNNYGGGGGGGHDTAVYWGSDRLNGAGGFVRIQRLTQVLTSTAPDVDTVPVTITRDDSSVTPTNAGRTSQATFVAHIPQRILTLKMAGNTDKIPIKIVARRAIDGTRVTGIVYVDLRVQSSC